MEYCCDCNSYICKCKKEKEENSFMFIKKTESFKLPEIDLPKASCLITKSEFVKATCTACRGFGLDPWNSVCFDCNGSGYILVRKEDVYWGRR